MWMCDILLAANGEGSKIPQAVRNEWSAQRLNHVVAETGLDDMKGAACRPGSFKGYANHSADSPADRTVSDGP